MKKLTDIFREKAQTFSFELFPPRSDEGFQNLLGTIKTLAALKPDFFSCTYGAGGGSRERTLEIAQNIQDTTHVPAVAHLTCVCHTKNEVKDILRDIQRRGIRNILALRGDPPLDKPDWQPGQDNFKYSCELCAFIRKNFGDFFGIGVAGFPEGHVLCPDRELDAHHLKTKIDNGADFVITQLFFNNQDYFDYVKRLRKLGVTARIIPGVLPITDYPGLVRFCQKCGTTVTDEVKKIFSPIADDKEKLIAEGIKFTVSKCREMLAGGAPGIHFYPLNKAEPTATVFRQITD